MISAKLLIFFGAGLIALAGWRAWREHAWLKSARIMPATVIELIRVNGNKGRSTYQPRIRYVTADGAIHDLIRADAPGPFGVHAGERLAVAYHDATPQDLRILTFSQRFGLAAIVAVLGVCVGLLGAAFLVGHQYVPRLYLQSQPFPAVAPGR